MNSPFIFLTLSSFIALLLPLWIDSELILRSLEWTIQSTRGEMTVTKCLEIGSPTPNELQFWFYSSQVLVPVLVSLRYIVANAGTLSRYHNLPVP